jgi:hypothetical protein
METSPINNVEVKTIKIVNAISVEYNSAARMKFAMVNCPSLSVRDEKNERPNGKTKSTHTSAKAGATSMSP